tara:strand:- start:193 stop:528 length:336 start_codon:yes stop_codon:yes gene_type:complete
MKERIIKAIEKCFDPEIPVDLWNLGLIYNIDFESNNQDKITVNITMTLTTPGCNMAEHIANDLKGKILSIDNVSKVHIDITFDPPWEPKMMSDKAKKILGLGSNNKNNNWE